jgi:hypothetical protein
VLSYRPILADKPLSCNLNHCEMFSCILGMEDETALSIIDPVTVNMEVTCQPHNRTTRGIADAIIPPSDRVLEVSSSVKLNLSWCVSYPYYRSCYSYYFASSSCHRGMPELAYFWSLCLIFSSVCPVTLPSSMSLYVLVFAVDDHYPQLYITVFLCFMTLGYNMCDAVESQMLYNKCIGDICYRYKYL